MPSSVLCLPHRFLALKAATLLLGALLLWQPATSRAVVYSFSGALATTDPTFNRPFTTTSLSGVGTNVYYDVQPFTLTLSGSTNLSTDSANFTPTPADDTFLCLYQTAFNPASPLTNLVAIDDDSGPGSLSLITANLTAGTAYFMVITSYSNGVTGTYTASITPANAAAIVVPSAVPEPGTMTALGLGIAGAGPWLRRARRRA